jgi:hypothetical protein
MTEVPQNPFTYIRQTFEDTAIRASQYEILFKIIYTKNYKNMLSIWNRHMWKMQWTRQRIQTLAIERSRKTNHRKIWNKHWTEISQHHNGSQSNRLVKSWSNKHNHNGN